MPKISSPVLFSSCFKINPKDLDNLGIFDPIINLDSKLFIDPLLLPHSNHKLIKTKATAKLKKFYENIISLLEKSQQKGDFAYKCAEKLIEVKEVPGTCLGYGTTSTSGRSLSKENRGKIIDTAYEIVKLGIKDPKLFILLPLFEEGIGADTISDITTSAIQSTLYDFTFQLVQKLNIGTSKYEYNGQTIDIIRNPIHRKISPIILLPKDILSRLPFASTWEDITNVSFFNHNLRNKVNMYISQVWEKNITKKRKAYKLAKSMKNKTGIKTLFEILDESPITPYNFQKDTDGIMFLQNTTDIISKYSSIFTLDNLERKDITKIVLDIINQFKYLIENKGTNRLLWKNDYKPHTEKTSQKIFHVVADSYCKANNIDINPEMDTGVGYIDFKFSKGYSKKVIVEIKHSYNPKLVDGYMVQLQTYKKSENTDLSYYVIIDVGNIGNKYKNLLKKCKNDTKKLSEIIYIDARIQLSASKRKTNKHNFSDSSFDTNFEVQQIDWDLPDLPVE